MTPAPIPEPVWRALLAFLDQVRGGLWNKGGQVTLDVSSDANVTAAEFKGRVEPQRGS